MTASEKKLPREKLEKTLRWLDIVVSIDPDGRYTAFTEQEPLFCFVNDTEEGVNAAVKRALQSYIDTFYNVGNVVIETIRLPLNARYPKAELSRPVSRIGSRISGNNPDRERELACA
jgi:hypothetical protein